MSRLIGGHVQRHAGGKRLFPESTTVDALELAEPRPVGDQGVVIRIYRPTRP